MDQLLCLMIQAKNSAKILNNLGADLSLKREAGVDVHPFFPFHA